jgi:hypothetical protein
MLDHNNSPRLIPAPADTVDQNECFGPAVILTDSLAYGFYGTVTGRFSCRGEIRSNIPKST